MESDTSDNFWQLLSGTEPYIHLYTTERAFPAAFDEARVISLEFRDAHVLRFSDPNDIIGLTQAEIDALDQIVLPIARASRRFGTGVK